MTVATGGAFAIHLPTEAVARDALLQGRGDPRGPFRGAQPPVHQQAPRAAAGQRAGAPERRASVVVSPEEVAVGEEIAVRPGERVPLDGIVLSGNGLVGHLGAHRESRCRAGCDRARRCSPGSSARTARLRSASREAPASPARRRSLRLVEEASHAKARTERFITRFARVYTPLVVAAAALVAFLPPLLVPGALLRDWVYRALTMLVISCPCALVVSIPLGYLRRGGRRLAARDPREGGGVPGRPCAGENGGLRQDRHADAGILHGDCGASAKRRQRPGAPALRGARRGALEPSHRRLDPRGLRGTLPAEPPRATTARSAARA